MVGVAVPACVAAFHVAHGPRHGGHAAARRDGNFDARGSFFAAPGGAGQRNARDGEEHETGLAGLHLAFLAVFRAAVRPRVPADRAAVCACCRVSFPGVASRAASRARTASRSASSRSVSEARRSSTSDSPRAAGTTVPFTYFITR